jgi:hypothetical protein
MHFWPNLSITKTASSLGKFKGNRPKGLTDEAWNALIAEYRLNKQIILNKVPKISKRDMVDKRAK